eukprot:2746473-Lingulodinium_polyedra.AAC.1
MGPSGVRWHRQTGPRQVPDRSPTGSGPSPRVETGPNLSGNCRGPAGGRSGGPNGPPTGPRQLPD